MCPYHCSCTVPKYLTLKFTVGSTSDNELKKHLIRKLSNAYKVTNYGRMSDESLSMVWLNVFLICVMMQVYDLIVSEVDDRSINEALMAPYPMLLYLNRCLRRGPILCNTAMVSLRLNN